LQIREDLKKGVYVENLTEIEVTSAREVMQQLLEVITLDLRIILFIQFALTLISVQIS